MMINIIIFGAVIGFLWFGLKAAWNTNKTMRALILVLALPILAFAGLFVLQLAGFV